MSPILSSGTGLSIVETNITTDGVDRDVVSSPQSNLNLFFTIRFDPNQVFDRQNRFTANFQIENYQTGQKTNNYWRDPLTAIAQGEFVWLLLGGSAAQKGVGTTGVYIYRPSFTITVVNPRELPQFIGLSHFAVAEEHFFIVEGF